MGAASLLVLVSLVALTQSPPSSSHACTPENGLLESTVDRASREPLEHVRSEERWIRAAIQQGMSRSKTFRDLIAALNKSDVIVYVIHAPIARDRSFAAYMDHSVTLAGRHRYVRIFVGRKAGDATTIATIAHELQHASEVADAPEVGRTLSATELFQRINGGGCLSGQCYETLAALNVQELVTAELLER